MREEINDERSIRKLDLVSLEKEDLILHGNHDEGEGHLNIANISHLSLGRHLIHIFCYYQVWVRPVKLVYGVRRHQTDRESVPLLHDCKFIGRDLSDVNANVGNLAGLILEGERMGLREHEDATRRGSDVVNLKVSRQ